MTSQVIAYTKRIDFRTLLDVECESLTGLAPIIKDSVEDFTSILSLFPDIGILVVDQELGGHESKAILDALISRESSIKNIIFLSDEPITLKTAKTFELSKVGGMIQHLRSLVEPLEIKAEGYISIPAESLIHFKILPFDLFIKISENKFIKRIPANEDIDETTVKGFQAKGIKELFFKRKFNRDFSLMLLNNMINKVESEYTDDNQKLKARSEVYATTREIVQSIGLPPKVIQVCESVMDKTAHDVSKGKDKFASYLSQIKTSKDLSFQFRFVELTSFVATQILNEMNEADMHEQIKTVVFAAFFCDISLTDPDYLKLRTEVEVADIWHTDQKAVYEHALDASTIVSKYKNAPENVEVIIKEHHGSLSGIGFPKKIEDVDPLSKCLIAAQEISLALLNEPKSEPKIIMSKLIDRFEDSPIQEYILHFNKL